MDAFAWADHQRDERAGLNAATESWDEQPCTTPFSCRLPYDDEDEGYGWGGGPAHIAIDQPAKCVGVTASAAHPQRRFVFHGRRVFYTLAECCMYPQEDDDERQRLDEECEEAGEGKWIDDGRFDNVHYLCESCHSNWRRNVNAVAAAQRKRKRETEEKRRAKKEAKPQESPSKEVKVKAARSSKSKAKCKPAEGKSEGSSSSSSSSSGCGGGGSSSSKSKSKSKSKSSAAAAAAAAESSTADLDPAEVEEYERFMRVKDHLSKVKGAGGLLTKCCAVNKLPKSGSKADKVDRIAEILVRGNPGQCTGGWKGNCCKKGGAQLEIEYEDGRPWGKKVGRLHCKQWLGQGRPCGYQRQLKTVEEFQQLFNSTAALVREPAALFVGLPG